MNNIKDIIKDKNSKIISTKEALKDVEPFFSEKELEYIIKNNKTIQIK